MHVGEAYTRLKGRIAGVVRRDEPLSRHTSYRIGGPADLYVECDTVSDLSSCVELFRGEGIDWTVLGRGTNVLVADEGYRGAVIVLGREFKRHIVEGDRLRCGAGVSLAAVVQDAFARGMTGLEFAVGIPGTVGGALVMNAGSREEWIGGLVESVNLYAPGRGLVSVRGPEVRWSYRRSDLSTQGVVVEASLKLEQGDEWSIRQSMEAALRRRRRTQPIGMPNAGSVFVNPEGDSAGRLIEACGLKGRRVGGAQVSDVHANFIVNTGGARATDVLALVALVQKDVKDAHGIELRPEIRFLGSFDTP